jgi:hypothetical protein
MSRNFGLKDAERERGDEPPPSGDGFSSTVAGILLVFGAVVVFIVMAIWYFSPQ